MEKTQGKGTLLKIIKFNLKRGRGRGAWGWRSGGPHSYEIELAKEKQLRSYSRFNWSQCHRESTGI